MKRLLFVCTLMMVWGCAPTEQVTEEPEQEEEELFQPERPIPYPIDIPDRFRRALENDTRNEDGRPGNNYWQQFAEYDIAAELDPSERKLYGRVRITYHNESPDELSSLHLDLIQNHHKEGVQRNRDAEVTGGMEIHGVEVAGISFDEGEDRDQYEIDNTRMILRPEDRVESGQNVEITVRYSFEIPQQGAGGRMGYDSDNLFYIGYWYPQMAVYDDITGWHPDYYLGNAEFYHGFADYDLSITVPEQWLVMATGDLQNGEEVLTEEIYDRAQQAWESDTTYQVITADDFGDFTRSGDASGTVTWEYRAEDVRDVAFSATTESLWDAARTSVGEGDDQEYVKINSVYRESAELWPDVTEFQQHAVSFLSDFNGFDYPWPHMTAVEGEGIIGGGMEFPMMTIIADYNDHGRDALYNVTAHEINHMWIPLIVSTDERRYGWLDEGHTVFATNESRRDFGLSSNHSTTRMQYLRFARLNEEIPIMRRSNYHYTYSSYISASYFKPSNNLLMLRGLLGDEIFEEAHREFVNSWAFKHPSPWDFFNIVEDVSGKDLEWFWRTWYFEAWLLDQQIESVESTENGDTRIVVGDHGKAPMPVLLRVVTSDDVTHEYKIPVDYWLAGRKEAEKIIPHSKDEIERIVIDPERYFPLINRSDARWERGD